VSEKEKKGREEKLEGKNHKKMREGFDRKIG
jgi:hypothetical protein